MGGESLPPPLGTSALLRRTHCFLWPNWSRLPLQPGGRRKRNTVRNRQKGSTDNSCDRWLSLQHCSSVKWKECSGDESASLPPVTGQEMVDTRWKR